VQLASNPLRRSAEQRCRVLNIAHRGARAFAPENTICAFEKAKTLGCDMFELDLHSSKDGELIVHHDEQLTRCTDVAVQFPGRQNYFVSDFTCAELKRLDAGSWYVKELAKRHARRPAVMRSATPAELRHHLSTDDRAFYASGEVRIPTLEEALQVAHRTGMMVDIEIKSLPRMYEGITESVVALVVRMDLEDRVLISSFDHEQVAIVRGLNQRIATGVVTCDRLARPGDYLGLLDADAYHPACHGGHDSLGFGSLSGKLDPRGIQHARAAGCGVNVWTCNDKDQMRQLIAAGVTGIITDFPNRVQEVLAESSQGA
jgi:glycerophosphoryl diester phosphodiesterase